MDGDKTSDGSWLSGIAQRWSAWWKRGKPEPPSQVLELAPPCAECGTRAGRVSLFEYPGGWRLAFVGVSGAGGGAGDPVSHEKARAIREALTPPYDPAKIRAAGFYDDFGFCAECGKFYCATHWKVSTTGGGTCPAGHFKSLDPHWHPDWDDL